MAVTKVVMPKLSEAMESGKIIKWLKKEGDRIQGGDILAEVETDKADVEMEAFGAGVLRKILVPAGELAPVGSLIGVIAEADEDIASVVATAQPAPAATMSERPAAVSPQPRSEDPAARQPSPASGPAAPARPMQVAATAPPAPSDQPAAPATGRVKASPLAKKIAAQSGVDLRVIQGSGPGGRIVRRDVEAAATRPAAAVPAAVAVADGHEYEDVALSQMRAIIAKRMPLSKAPVPHFYVTSEIAMDRAWALREELNTLDDQPKISLNDLVIRACALA